MGDSLVDPWPLIIGDPKFRSDSAEAAERFEKNRRIVATRIALRSGDHSDVVAFLGLEDVTQ